MVTLKDLKVAQCECDRRQTNLIEGALTDGINTPR